MAQVRIMRGPDGFGSNILRASSIDTPRAVIGLTTTGSATSRDTLGVLVSAVRPGSPAEKAGIEEGNRIASVNGVSLKLAAADVGDYDIAGSMTRRLSRELDKLKAGDEVELRVYANGQTKTVKVKTMAPADLYEATARRHDADRATLGINVAVTGSARDSIGVFVMSVEENGPAAKAGIEEGTRIASINGVDVRPRRASTDDEDRIFRVPNVTRLTRELEKVKPGDDVELRVYYNGQFRNVKVKAGRVSDLPRRNRATMIFGGDNLSMEMPPLPPMPRMPEISGEIRRAIEGARSMGAPRIGTRIVWYKRRGERARPAPLFVSR
jgi:S1-C subfamily serine protease